MIFGNKKYIFYYTNNEIENTTSMLEVSTHLPMAWAFICQIIMTVQAYSGSHDTAK